MSLDVEQLYTRYGPMVHRRCRALLQDDEAAAEATQEVFVRLIERAETLDARAPSSLLYRMATNHCLNRIRAKARRPEDPDSSLLQRIAALPEVEARTHARFSLRRIFDAQQESTREIAALFFLDGMTLAEVAEEVGMSVSGVRKRLRKLKEDLDPEDAMRGWS